MDEAAATNSSPTAETTPLAVHVAASRVPAINLVETLLRAADGRGPAEPRFAALHAWAKSNVRLVGSAGEANLVLFPGDYAADFVAAGRAADEAERLGRVCLFFDAGDTWTPFALPSGLLYRTSCDRAAMLPNERAMPAFAYDLIDEAAGYPEIADATLGPISHDELPSVGFVGYVGSGASRFKALVTGQTQKWRGLTMRARAIDALRQARELRYDGISRESFGGDVQADASRRLDRLAFLRNVFDNAYTLSMRGKGNFSFRFYEVLGAGRVPLFVDTRCVLPFEDEIDWRRLIAWCEYDEVDQIGRRVAEFHARFDRTSFDQRQRELRELWLSHLSPLGFFQQLVRRHSAGL